MSSNETSSTLDSMSAAVRAVTKLTKDCDQSDEKLTAEMLASAIKLASLSTDHQEKLTPVSVNAAIKIAKNSSNQEEENQNLTLDSLAMALKLATKVSQSDHDDTEEISTNQMLAGIKAAIVMIRESQADEPVTPEILADAIKLANN